MRTILLILLIIFVSPLLVAFWIIGFIYEQVSKEPDEDIESIEDLFL